MNVRIMTRRIGVDNTAREFIRRCIANALDRRLDRIADVVIALEDLNGPRGGKDQRCCVTLLLSPRGSVRARATGSDLWSVVDRAVQKAARQLDRLLESSWSSRRRLYRRRQFRAA
jgi:ribosome-associated translation inhibitor RaiA